MTFSERGERDQSKTVPWRDIKVKSLLQILYNKFWLHSMQSDVRLVLPHYVEGFVKVWFPNKGLKISLYWGFHFSVIPAGGDSGLSDLYFTTLSLHEKVDRVNLCHNIVSRFARMPTISRSMETWKLQYHCRNFWNRLVWIGDFTSIWNILNTPACAAFVTHVFPLNEDILSLYLRCYHWTIRNNDGSHCPQDCTVHSDVGEVLLMGVVSKMICVGRW